MGAISVMSALVTLSHTPQLVTEEMHVEPLASAPDVAAAAAEEIPSDAAAAPAVVVEESHPADPDDAPDSVPGPPAAPLAPYRWTAADVLAARAVASPRARCVIDREVGGYGFDPWIRGRAGERGPVQLHPRGLLPEYVAWSGGAAPENPYVAVPFLERKLAQGEGRHWAPIRLGLC